MPYYLLVFSFVLIYVRPGTIFPFVDTIKLGTIIPILVFIISLFIKSNISSSEVWAHRNTKWLLFFMFLVIVSLTFTAGPDTLDRLKLVVGNFFLYFSICRIVDTKEKLKGIFATLSISHIAIISLNPDLVLDPSTRTYVAGLTFLGDGNDFGLSLCILFPLALYLYLDTDKKYSRLLFIFTTVLSALAIVGTQSRGASLALGGILGYLWLKSRAKFVGLIALFVLLVTALLFASPEYFARMNTLANYSEEGSAQGRIDAWNAAIMMAVHWPVLGVGAANFGEHNHNLTAHSMYFLALGELGIPGAIFIVSYMVQNFRQMRRILKNIKKEDESNLSYQRLFIYLNGSLLGLAIAGAFLSALYYPHLFVVGALLVTAEKIYKLDREGRLEENQQASKDQINKGVGNNIYY